MLVNHGRATAASVPISHYFTLFYSEISSYFLHCFILGQSNTHIQFHYSDEGSKQVSKSFFYLHSSTLWALGHWSLKHWGFWPLGP